jgi:hypothetical protein
MENPGQRRANLGLPRAACNCDLLELAVGVRLLRDKVFLLLVARPDGKPESHFSWPTLPGE